MTVLGRILRAYRPLRTIASSKTLNPPSPNNPNPRFLSRQSIYHQQHNVNASEIQWSKTISTVTGLYFILPALVASLLGNQGLQTSRAEADAEFTGKTLPSEPQASYVDLEEIAKRERLRIEESIRNRGMRTGSYPRFIIAVKGQKVTLKFHIPPGCEVPKLIATLVSHLGLKAEQRDGGSDMSLRAWDSAVTWNLMLTQPGNQKEAGNQEEADLCVLLFGSLVTTDKAEIEFIKRGSFSEQELDAFVSILELAGGSLRGYNAPERRETPSYDKSVSSLESMGVRVYGLYEPNLYSSDTQISWENIAGYHQQKREIEDTILLALQSPEVYDEIARGTRRKFESNRPRAVLFEGPPGTGKTSSARVIANQAGVPLLYVPLEVVMSKYYGESERLLAKVFSLANEFPDGAIIFLDEVDSFAVARDGEMHEATRRVLSVLLRQIDGFEQDKKVVVIAATNRKQDLDPALISRFDSIIIFGLPDRPTRSEIAAQYAKHLTESELDEFAAVTQEMSGRDIRDVCQQAERSWASKIIRGQESKQGLLPPLKEYIESAVNRRKGLSTISDAKALGLNGTVTKKFRVVVD